MKKFVLLVASSLLFIGGGATVCSPQQTSEARPPTTSSTTTESAERTTSRATNEETTAESSTAVQANSASNERDSAPSEDDSTPSTEVPDEPSYCAELGRPRVKVLVIGDGMGTEQILAGRLGNDGPLSFEQFPSSGTMTTASADNAITDSAAAATAMATGQKVNNYVVAQAIPGDRSDLTSIVELYEDCGFRTGIVTSSRVTHATPASFAAHHTSRWEEGAIIEDYLNGEMADIIVGGGLEGFEAARSENSEIRILRTKREFLALTALPQSPLLVMLGDSHLPYEADREAEPSLLEQLAVHTLSLLNDGESPMFLLIEGARIDHAGHSNDFARMWPEVIALSETVTAIQDELAESQAFIFVTGDHETGGLHDVERSEEGLRGRWSSTKHTADPVPYFAWGILPDNLPEEIDTTDVFELFGGRVHHD